MRQADKIYLGVHRHVISRYELYAHLYRTENRNDWKCENDPE